MRRHTSMMAAFSTLSSQLVKLEIFLLSILYSLMTIDTCTAFDKETPDSHCVFALTKTT